MSSFNKKEVARFTLATIRVNKLLKDSFTVWQMEENKQSPDSILRIELIKILATSPTVPLASTLLLENLLISALEHEADKIIYSETKEAYTAVFRRNEREIYSKTVKFKQ